MIDGQKAILAVQNRGHRRRTIPRSLLSSEFKFSVFFGRDRQTDRPKDGQARMKRDGFRRRQGWRCRCISRWLYNVGGQAGRRFRQKKDLRSPTIGVSRRDERQSPGDATDHRPAGLDDGFWKRGSGPHSSSVAIIAEDGTNQIEIVAALARGLPEGPVESRGQLPLPRPAASTILRRCVMPVCVRRRCFCR